MSTRANGWRPAAVACLGNALLTVLKTIGFLISGSTAMFSEAVHSAADTANQVLLLIGVWRSKKAADEKHAYGYGNERFLWALISACGIFFVGAGVTIYKGIETIIAGGHPELSLITFAILIAAACIEGYALSVAYTELRREYPDDDLVDALRDGDPITVAVIYEDTVAVIGVGVALAGVSLTYVTGNALWDGIASVIIGLLLACVAVILIQKNRGYLIGKSIPEDEQEAIIEILENEPYIERVIDFKSSILDIGHYHIKCEIEFNGAALTDELGDMRDIFDEVNGDYEEFKKFLAYNSNRIPRIMGRKIDEAEKKITAAFPSVKHIDIEIN
jgi:zinc transporter 9